MSRKSLKNLSPGPKFLKKILVVLIGFSIILASYLFLERASSRALQTVEVVRVKSKEGIKQGTLIDSHVVSKYHIIQKEFTDDMITYDKVDEVLNSYSLYYLRGNSVIFKDQITKEKPLKNEWLYKVPPENEVITIPYNYLECAGDILTPGDTIRVRIAYDEETKNADSNSPYAYIHGNTIRKTELLFKSLKIRDLLNSQGHSIYEVYKEVLKLPFDEKQDVLKSTEFLRNVLPRALVLEASSLQIDKYALYSNKKDISFTFTILSREEKTSIFNQIPTIQKEVESWIKE